jgi:hypothetical protein
MASVPYARVDAQALPVVIAVQVVTRDPEPFASVRMAPRRAIGVPTRLQLPAANVGVHDRFAPAPRRVIVDFPVPLVYATSVTAASVPDEPVQVRSTTSAAAAGVAPSEAVARRAASEAASNPAVRRRAGRRRVLVTTVAAGPDECCMRDGPPRPLGPAPRGREWVG